MASAMQQKEQAGLACRKNIQEENSKERAWKERERRTAIQPHRQPWTKEEKIDVQNKEKLKKSEANLS